MSTTSTIWMIRGLIINETKGMAVVKSKMRFAPSSFSILCRYPIYHPTAANRNPNQLLNKNYQKLNITIIIAEVLYEIVLCILTLVRPSN